MSSQDNASAHRREPGILGELTEVCRGKNLVWITEVRRNLNSFASAERHPVSPDYPTFTGTSSPLPFDHPASQKYPTTIPPPSPLYGPAACPAISPSSILFGNSAFSEYPTIARSSFPLFSLNHPASSEYPAVAQQSFPLHHPVSPAYPVIPPPSFPSSPGLSIRIDHRLESSQMVENHAHHKDQKISSKSCQRTCIAQHRAITADLVR